MRETHTGVLRRPAKLRTNIEKELQNLHTNAFQTAGAIPTGRSPVGILRGVDSTMRDGPPQADAGQAADS